MPCSALPHDFLAEVGRVFPGPLPSSAAGVYPPAHLAYFLRSSAVGGRRLPSAVGGQTWREGGDDGVILIVFD